MRIFSCSSSHLFKRLFSLNKLSWHPCWNSVKSKWLRFISEPSVLLHCSVLSVLVTVLLCLGYNSFVGSFEIELSNFITFQGYIGCCQVLGSPYEFCDWPGRYLLLIVFLAFVFGAEREGDYANFRIHIDWKSMYYLCNLKWMDRGLQCWICTLYPIVVTNLPEMG